MDPYNMIKSIYSIAKDSTAWRNSFHDIHDRIDVDSGAIGKWIWGKQKISISSVGNKAISGRIWANKMLPVLIE